MGFSIGKVFAPIENEMKKYAEKSYGSKGQAILDMNFNAIDSGVNNIVEVSYLKKIWPYVGKFFPIQNIQ